MLARDHRLIFALAVAIGICAWTASTAHASYVMTPGTIATPVTSPGTTSMATGELTAPNETGSRKVDLALGSCTGAGGGTFTISPTNAQVTSPITVTVTYDPGATTGFRSCSVNVFAEATTTNPLTTFTVTGDSQGPPRVMLSTTSLTFNAVRVFDNAVTASFSTRTVTVTNSGNQTLNITGLTFTGDYSLDPGSATPSSTTITGGNSKTWTIRFNPSASGPRTGSVRFVSNAANNGNASETTVNLTGDGTTGAFSTVASSSGNFGTVAGGSTAALDVVLTHTGVAPKGTLTITSATVSSSSSWFAVSSYPGTLTGTSITGAVAITCSPPVGATTTQMATVTVRADSDSSNGTNYETQTANVTCQGGSSALALSANTVDFDPQLVNTTSTSKTLTITNTGTSPATLTFSSTSQGRFSFTVSTPGDCGLAGNPGCPIAQMGQAGNTVQVTATFTPDAEGSVSAGYGIGGSGGLNFILTGKGIDRHIAVPDTIQVADTFRNPGDKATVAPVTVTNSGEYPIMVSNLVMNGEPIWSLEDASPFEIPGGGTHDVMVRFSPMVAGKADDGQLLIMNDDLKIANGMPIVLLSGNGKDRNVDMTPGSIDVGDTFAGVPTRLSITRPDDMLVVSNMEMPDPDGATDFTIRDVTVQGEGDVSDMFEVVDLSGDSIKGRKLAAGENLRVDVVFKPTYVGNFEATLLLYLDQDTQAQRPVSVRGRALFVDAAGSGGFGCQTGRTSRGAMLLVMAALVLVLRRRRR